ncbi:MAG: hypothetical protein ACLRRT_07405 [Ruthenibacterium lactatiformans]
MFDIARHAMPRIVQATRWTTMRLDAARRLLILCARWRKEEESTMEYSDLYADIAERTGGDIYIGVVGPVRTGKAR